MIDKEKQNILDDGFTIKGESGNYLTLRLLQVYGFPNKTCHWGGYDARAELVIKAGDFQVRSALFTTTADVFTFYQLLKECNSELKGSAVYESYEGNLVFTAVYDLLGHVKIQGEFFENRISDNKLIFSFDSDQSFIKFTLDELELFVKKYGGLTGRKWL